MDQLTAAQRLRCPAPYGATEHTYHSDRQIESVSWHTVPPWTRRRFPYSAGSRLQISQQDARARPVCFAKQAASGHPKPNPRLWLPEECPRTASERLLHQRGCYARYTPMLVPTCNGMTLRSPCHSSRMEGWEGDKAPESRPGTLPGRSAAALASRPAGWTCPETSAGPSCPCPPVSATRADGA